MDDITIHVGVCTTFGVKLSKLDFNALDIAEVIFTVKNAPEVDSPVIIERRFTEAKDYPVTVTAEESIRLTRDAVYDFNKITSKGDRERLSNLGKIVLEKGAGDCIDD